MKRLLNFAKENRWILTSLLLLVVCVLTGGSGVLMADAVTVTPSSDAPAPSAGTAGLNTQLSGQATTVSAAAGEEGVGGDGLIQPDIDKQIVLIGTDENPLDTAMRTLKRKVIVKSQEVDHYLIDERKSFATTTAAYAAAQAEQAVIPVAAGDNAYFKQYDTVIAKDVNGYNDLGNTPISGCDLMLFVVGKDTTTGNPIMRAINGPKTNTTDEFSTVPAIPLGTDLIFLANACAETQKFVSPDMVIPTPSRVYLQKMIMNSLVSDYFDSQTKRIPFAQATIAEAEIREYRRKMNRSLWIGQKGKFHIDRGDMGQQLVYTTQGIRWQFKRQYDHPGSWTFDEVIALSKMKFTGQNVSKSAMWFMGSDQLSSIQQLDFTKYKDITMSKATVWGLECTQLHTVFGDFYLKYEPTFDYIGYSHSGAILDMDGIVRYTMKDEETSEERVVGEEAKRRCVISTNALALKGTSHIWVNGESNASSIPGAVAITNWSDATNAPTSPTLNAVYLLTVACAGISESAAGELWQWNGTAWVKYNGTIYVAES